MGLSDCPVAVAPLHHREGNAGIGMEMGVEGDVIERLNGDVIDGVIG